MTSVLLKTLNNYPEVKTDAGIDGIIAYLNSAGIAPRVFPREYFDKCSTK